MTSLREPILTKLKQARAVLTDLLSHDDGESTAVEWQKGYVKALEEVLDLQGLSLRQFPRRHTLIEASARSEKQTDDQWGDVTIVDLSEGGCRLATPVRFTVGESVQIVFPLPGVKGDLKLDGRIRNVQPVDDEFRAGVEFTNTPPDAVAALKEFCAPRPTEQG
jgi:hypothetical protein